VRVAIDLSVANISQAGTATYARTLLETLKRVDSFNEYFALAVEQQRDMSVRKTFSSRLETVYRDIVWMHGVLPWQAHRTKVDILHMPANVIPLFSPCPVVVTIHDLTVLTMPQNFTFWHRNYSRTFVPLAARHASRILTVSEQSKRDIVEQLGVAPDKVAVTYEAASPRFRPLSEREIAGVRQRYDLLEPFILNVGTIEPRKNLLRLLQAFATLRREGFSYQLVQAGPRGWLFDSVLAEVNRLELRDSVRFLGRVPVEDLVGLYNAATVFAYPSLYEGFGLPVLEAMACGCPVVTSNTSSLPEVVGQAGTMIDPLSVGDLADAIQEVLEDRVVAQDMRQRGLERASQFSWQRCAEETLAVYRQVLGL